VRYEDVCSEVLFYVPLFKLKMSTIGSTIKMIIFKFIFK